MGKTNSKFSAESSSQHERLKQQSSCSNIISSNGYNGVSTSTTTNTTRSSSSSSTLSISTSPTNNSSTNNNNNHNHIIIDYPLNEKKLRNMFTGFNRDNPDPKLTQILDNQDLLAPFLTDIFYQEVEVSDCMQTLFRGNCMASKIMSHCFRTFGSDYLKQLLRPHIRPLLLEQQNKNNNTTKVTAQEKLIQNKSDNDIDIEQETSAFNRNKNLPNNNNNNSASSPPICGTTSSLSNSENNKININNNNNNDDSLLDSSANIENTAQFKLNNNYDNDNLDNSISYEIDSTRLDPANGNIDINQRNLLKLTRKILESILASADDFPPQLNSMCICLLQVLCKKYPNSNTNLKAVGTVIFLRFINPAIVSPYEAGIVDTQPPQKIMRGLMLVSKILQNIANNVEFSKEEHMLPFNDFVRAQFEPMRKWVSKISSEQSEK